MPRDGDQSLGGDQTFSGKVERDDSPQSLGDHGTYMGSPGVRDTQSLGDQSTFGNAGADDEPFDDGMEVVDLSAPVYDRRCARQRRDGRSAAGHGHASGA